MANHWTLQAGVLAALGAVLLAVAPTALAESDSWEWGYDHAGDMVDLLQDGWSPESVCRSTAGAAIRWGGEEWLDKPEATEGCLEGLRDMGRID